MIDYRAGRHVNEIVVHCAATPEGRDISVADIRRWHVDGNGWRDIGYHFVVTLDGTIHQGRPINQTGAHVRGRNRGTIGVCYVGGVANDGKMTPKDTRNVAQKQALDKLLRNLLEANPEISHISGHRDYAAKACPSFDATTEYRPLLTRRQEQSQFLDNSQADDAAETPRQSPAPAVTGVSITGVATALTGFLASTDAPMVQLAIVGLFGALAVGGAIWWLNSRQKEA